MVVFDGVCFYLQRSPACVSKCQGMAGSHRPRSQGQPPPHMISYAHGWCSDADHYQWISINRSKTSCLSSGKLYLVWLSSMTLTLDSVELFHLPNEHMQIAKMFEVSSPLTVDITQVAVTTWSLPGLFDAFLHYEISSASKLIYFWKMQVIYVLCLSMHVHTCYHHNRKVPKCSKVELWYIIYIYILILIY